MKLHPVFTRLRKFAAAVLLAVVAAVPGVAAEYRPTMLITGANTGHGLAFAEEYAALGWKVIAACRTPAKADRLTLDDAGVCYEWTGRVIPW